jgi:bifunctional ADP-heptose synthase (sugar kinase/adenylyltransferase)
MKYEDEAYNDFKKKLKEKVADYDAVFLCDFGHGLIDQEIIDIIEKNAKYLVMNCQTNSTNRGLNLITKYHRADAFSLDQQELKLAFPQHATDEETALQELSKHLHGSGWLTRGSKGAYQVHDGAVASCPAFTLNVKDTIGAGDAFFAMSGIFAAAGAPIEVGTFIGNIGGALGANIVGNKDSLEKVNVLKFASTLMNV